MATDKQISEMKTLYNNLITVTSMSPYKETFAAFHSTAQVRKDVCAMIMAQKAEETTWGTSETYNYLCGKWFNYWGMTYPKTSTDNRKCAAKINGGLVETTVAAAYKAGAPYCYRIYDNMTAGIKGYFDFIEENPANYGKTHSATNAYDWMYAIAYGGWLSKSQSDKTYYYGTCVSIYEGSISSIFDASVIGSSPTTSSGGGFSGNGGSGRVTSQTQTTGAVTEDESSKIEYKTVTRTAVVERDALITDTSATSKTTVGTSLLSSPTMVIIPFVEVDIAGVTFGGYSRTTSFNGISTTQYPNYVKSMEVTKVNGEVNSYSISLEYTVGAGHDPNYIDKILSKVGYGNIKIRYGDFSLPNYIYTEEEALITKVSTSMNFSTSQINYTITAVSSCFSLLGSSFTFPANSNRKPSSIIYDLLFGSAASQYGLSKIFNGMTKQNFSKYVASDDAAVKIEEKSNVDALTYLNYLVGCMIPSGSGSSSLASATYTLVISDSKADNGGSYFTVNKISGGNAGATYTYSSYTVDVGYPSDSPVINFQVEDDQSWALLYDWGASGITNENVTHTINNDGIIVDRDEVKLTTSDTLQYTTASAKSWWSSMTQFPIKATLTVRGMLRPTLLCSYVKVNSYIHGYKHISSGLYIITKQVDSIGNSSGYVTTLSLTRVAGDFDHFEKVRNTVTYTTKVRVN